MVEILSNTCLYNIFDTYFSYRGYLLAVNLQIYLGTSSLKRANNIPKLPGVDYVAKNWALAMMLKALPLVHFWSVLLLKEKTGLLIFRGQKSKISRDFQGQIRRKIGRFRGKKVKIRGTIGQFRAIFAGEKSKFAEKSAHFAGF